jgi:hypothetical protein
VTSVQPVKNILQLRQLLAERFPAVRTLSETQPARASAVHPTGIAPIDTLFNGGLPARGIIELVCPGAGGALILPQFLRQARASGQWLALIDGLDSFDPTSLAPDTLARLLWVRCRDAAQALQAADLLLRDGNLSLVLLDLRINPPAQLRKISGTVWHRFQRLLEQTPTALLVITPRALVSSAQARLTVRGMFTLDALEQSDEESLAQLEFQLQPRRMFAEEPPHATAAEAG